MTPHVVLVRTGSAYVPKSVHVTCDRCGAAVGDVGGPFRTAGEVYAAARAGGWRQRPVPGLAQPPGGPLVVHDLCLTCVGVVDEGSHRAVDQER